MNALTTLDTPASVRTRQLHAKILSQADEMESLVQESEQRLQTVVASVSGWSVAKHLEHLAISAEEMIKAIDQGLVQPPPNANKRPSIIGYLPLWFGAMPRGKAKCPPEVHPLGIALQSLRSRLLRVRDQVAGLEARLGAIETATGRTRHPMLGFFSSFQWLQMLEIHQRHHFKIIRDIRKAMPGDRT